MRFPSMRVRPYLHHEKGVAGFEFASGPNPGNAWSNSLAKPSP